MTLIPSFSTCQSGKRAGHFASKVLVYAVLKEPVSFLTPKEFANFSPGFPTLGKLDDIKILFTLKELSHRLKLFQS